MTRPVIIGASVCGLLMLGLVVRPTFWSAGPRGSSSPAALERPSVPAPIEDLAAAEAVPLRTQQEWRSHYRAHSKVELRREAEILWLRATRVQAELHNNPTSENREYLLGQFEAIVEKSNAVHALLEL